MGKKRRVWWIVGSFVLLLLAIGFFIDYNRTDARVERAVAQIIEEYGFEFRSEVAGFSPGPKRWVASKGYSRAPMSEETASEIVAILRDAWPSCSYDHTGYDKDLVAGTTGDDPWIDVHVFLPQERDGGSTASILFYPDDKGYGIPGAEPTATISVSTFDRPSLWQRIKGLWPW
ncbi:MAG: hypothetical protein IH945_05515 [Armatimonadetes bacterium]|nr:hypothetical protein [Armatimonadota bacterium]